MPEAARGAARLVLVEQYFYPEGWGGAEIPRDIAAGLRASGYAVDVLCSSEQYAPVESDGSPDPARLGIRILRVPRIVPGGVHRMKLVRVLWFCFYALPRLLLDREVDVFVTQTNPALIVPTVALVAALRRKPFVIIAQDLYPEVLFAAAVGRAHSWPGKLLRALFNQAYRRAARIIALGPVMRQRIQEKGVALERIRVISNWATGGIEPIDRSRNALREEWNLGGSFVLLYSGNLGVGHEFETLLSGVQAGIAGGLDLLLVIIGGGMRLGEVRARVSELGLESRVRFRSFVPAHALSQALGVADLALVTLREGFQGLIVPSKLLGYMARGIPVLYIGPESDISEMIQSTDCGACVTPGDVAAVARLLGRIALEPALLQRWAEQGRTSYELRFARELGVAAHVAVVREVIGSTEEP